jgi:hypothetical protein
VNTDVTVYFARNPAGDWISLQSTTNSSGLGLGMTDSLLYDTSGFVGTANKSIFFDSLIRREPEHESRALYPRILLKDQPNLRSACNK